MASAIVGSSRRTGICATRLSASERCDAERDVGDQRRDGRADDSEERDQREVEDDRDSDAEAGERRRESGPVAAVQVVRDQQARCEEPDAGQDDEERQDRRAERAPYTNTIRSGEKTAFDGEGGEQSRPWCRIDVDVVAAWLSGSSASV